jgi:hypothetical protein
MGQGVARGDYEALERLNLWDAWTETLVVIEAQVGASIARRSTARLKL